MANKTGECATIPLAIKKLKGIIPYSALDKLLKKFIEQAEGQHKDWPRRRELNFFNLFFN